MLIRIVALLTLLFSLPVHGADLVRIVRMKISAGDLATGMAAVEDYRQASVIDAEYLDAVGWLARGAEMMHRVDLADRLVAELHRAVPRETPEMLIPFGAAIEVEGRLIAARDGRGAAVGFFDSQLARAESPALRSRISKNINLLSLEGRAAPALAAEESIGTASSLESLRGRPVLLFFFAEWCGDCKAQARSLAQVWERYRPRDLAMVTVTRLYGGSKEKPMTPAEERAQVEKVWQESYPGLSGVPIVISTASMIRYGASATPTFALIDRKGNVRWYSPTRLSEEELSRRIEELLREK